MSFHQAVRDLIQDSLKETTHTVQGYIPNGKIDYRNWLAQEVRIPHPHMGTQPTQGGDGLTLSNVPLPKGFSGVIQALLDEVFGNDRAVLIGFKGGRTAFPHIIQFLDPLAPLDKVQHENTKNRNPVESNRLQTVGAVTSRATAGPMLPDPVGNDRPVWSLPGNAGIERLKRQATADPNAPPLTSPGAPFLQQLENRRQELSKLLGPKLGPVLTGTPAPRIGTPGIAPRSSP